LLLACTASCLASAAARSASCCKASFLSSFVSTCFAHTGCPLLANVLTCEGNHSPGASLFCLGLLKRSQASKRASPKRPFTARRSQERQGFSRNYAAGISNSSCHVHTYALLGGATKCQPKQVVFKPAGEAGQVLTKQQETKACADWVCLNRRQA